MYFAGKNVNIYRGFCSLQMQLQMKRRKKRGNGNYRGKFVENSRKKIAVKNSSKKEQQKW